MTLIHYLFQFLVVEYKAGKKSPSSKRTRANLTLFRGNSKIVIPDVLIDGGYSETLCLMPKYAKNLGLVKKTTPEHGLILGNGVVTEEYAYELAENEYLKCNIEFEASQGRGRKKLKQTSTCTINPVYFGESANILGAEAISDLRLCVIAGKGLRKATAHKC
jgi:hypothetical protein